MSRIFSIRAPDDILNAFEDKCKQTGIKPTVKARELIRRFVLGELA